MKGIRGPYRDKMNLIEEDLFLSHIRVKRTEFRLFLDDRLTDLSGQLQFCGPCRDKISENINLIEEDLFLKRYK